MTKPQVEAELCRREYYYFLQKFIHIAIKDEIVWNWHIKYLCDKMQEYGRCILSRTMPPKPYLIINIPPGSTKSTICTQFFPLWLWINDLTIVTIALSYSSSLSLRHATRSRDVLRSNEFKELFPNIIAKADQDAVGSYANTEGGQRISSSIGGTVLGDHAHIQIVDDPLNVEGAVSQAERTSANDFIRHTLPTRKKDKQNTPTILIMQRLHEEDPTGMILEVMKDDVEHICLPAELSNEVRPESAKQMYVDELLDPKRLSKSILEGQRKILGTVGYAQQFLQKAVPQEGALLKRIWFSKRISHANFLRNVKSQGTTINYYMDTAYTEKQKNDPTLILATTYFDGHLYLVATEKKRMEFPELLKFIPTFVHQHGFDVRTKIVIEPKASGQSVGQQLKKETAFNVLFSNPPTDDKLTRATSVAPFCEAMRIILVEGDWNEDFVGQLTTFPNAKHDEEVDVLVMAIQDNVKQQQRKPIY